mgnify:CR=1 FL=1
MFYDDLSYDSSVIAKKLNNEPFGILLFKGDTVYHSLMPLQQKYEYNKTIDIIDMPKGEGNVEAYLIPVQYNLSDDISTTKCRDFAVNQLYQKWCSVNGKTVKQPYDSKEFMRYLGEIGFTCSDYVLILAD